jgi:hypothetical protein
MSSSDGNNGDQEGGNWWDGWIKKAKEKSMSTLQLIKNDLNEFSDIMKSDFNQISTQLQATNKPLIEAMASLNLTINKSSTNSNIQSQETLLATNRPITDSFDRKKNEITNIQNNEDTYINDPDGDEYNIFYDSYDPDTQKGDISNLLIENPTMRALYSKLVPANVSNKDFWSRYFYRVKLIEEEFERRNKLIEKATNSKASEEAKLNWDEEEDNTKVEAQLSVQNLESKTEDSENDWEKITSVKEVEETKAKNNEKDAEKSDDWESWD